MEKVKCPHCNKEFPLEEGFQPQLKALQNQAREKGKNESETENKKILEENKKLEEKNKEKDEIIKNSKTLHESDIKNAREDEKLKSQTEIQQKDLKLKRTEQENQNLQKIVKKQKTIIDQGGSADQGSAQEIVLLDYLKNKVFKYKKEDKFFSYGKGKKGGDVLHEVIEGGQLVGKVLYESKNTSNFENKWMSKINIDLRDSKADVGIIFTKTIPRYFNKDEDFYQDNNIFICQYDYPALRMLARINRLNLIDAKKSLKDPKSNQTGVIEFYNNPDNKTRMVRLSQLNKSSQDQVKKIITHANKAADDLDKTDEELETLFKNLSKVGVHFKK